VALSPKLQGHVTHTQKDDMFGRQRKKQEGQQRHQYEVANKYVFERCRLIVDSDDDVTNDGKLSPLLSTGLVVSEQFCGTLFVLQASCCILPVLGGS